MKESTLVYDIETARPIRDPKEKQWHEIEYAASWEDYEGMGIACIACFDYEERRFRVFDMQTLSVFRSLVRSREKVVGWNNHNFDDRLLAAHGVHVEQSLDLMALYPYRLSLEKAAEANGIAITKSMPGKMAPIKWQKGHHGAVIDYCIGDVHITSLLYSKYRKQGYLLDTRGRRVR